MVLQSPVYSSRGRLLLNTGRILTDNYIAALKKMGVLAVQIKGVDGLDAVEADRVLSNEVKIEALTSIQSFVERNMTEKSYKVLVISVQNIINEVLSGRIPIGGLSEISAHDSYTYAHSVDVCALSITIGYQMKLPRSTLVQLGMGGLLHDLGKTRIPIEILNKPSELTDKESVEMKKHPLLGYNIACYEFEKKLDDEAANIILNHHERHDGSGYPRGLKGPELSTLDMICGLADMYNAMTTDRVYRRSHPYSEAYEMLLGSGDNYFPIEVVEAFAQCVVPYPVGTFVEMSDGSRACVTRSNPSLPTRPVVRILSTDEFIDLSENLTLVIKSQLPPEDIIRLALTKNH